MKYYLFIYSNTFGERDRVKQIIESISIISNWRYDLPNCFYITSESSANELAEEILQRVPNTRFLISEVSENKQGWLPKDTWKFLNGE